jgi:tetratricopeptide (TPR) repeat protein
MWIDRRPQPENELLICRSRVRRTVKSAFALVLFVALPSFAAEPAAPSWLASHTVESLALREKVAAPLAEAAEAQLRAGNPLGASYAARACLLIDRYRCPCIRDAARAMGGMKSADAATLAAVHTNAWSQLMEYVSCDETADDAPKIFALAKKWGGGAEYPYPMQPVPRATLEATSSQALLAEGNARFTQLVPLEAKRRFELCALREPVNCACVRRAGDAWLQLEDRERAIVWWSRYLDCMPKAPDRPMVEKDIAAARTALTWNPIWEGVFTEPSSPVTAFAGLAREHLAKAKAAVKDKRLDDALASFIVCRLLDPKAWECPIALADTLDQLRRFDDAREVRELLIEQLPRSHPLRASVLARLK